MFLGLERASEGILGAILGSSGKFRSQDPVRSIFLAKDAKGAKKRLRLLANLALFARGILRLGCPVRLGQCPGLIAEFPSRSLAIPDRYFPDEPNLGVPGAD